MTKVAGVQAAAAELKVSARELAVVGIHDSGVSLTNSLSA